MVRQSSLMLDIYFQASEAQLEQEGLVSTIPYALQVLRPSLSLKVQIPTPKAPRLTYC